MPETSGNDDEVFELVLRSDEPLSAPAKIAHFQQENPDEKAVVIVKCKIADGDVGFEPGSLLFTKDHKEIEQENSRPRSITYKVDIDEIFEREAEHSSEENNIPPVKDEPISQEDLWLFREEKADYPKFPGNKQRFASPARFSSSGNKAKSSNLLNKPEITDNLNKVNTVNLTFECSAQRKVGGNFKGKFQNRSLKLALSRSSRRKFAAGIGQPSSSSHPTIRMPHNSRQCEFNHCKNGGLCVTQADDPSVSYCVCVNGFSGQTCERLDGILKDTEAKNSSTLYAGIALILIFMAFLGTLLGRERRKHLQYKRSLKQHSLSIRSKDPEKQNMSTCSLQHYEFVDGRESPQSKRIICDPEMQPPDFVAIYINPYDNVRREDQSNKVDRNWARHVENGTPGNLERIGMFRSTISAQSEEPATNSRKACPFPSAASNENPDTFVRLLPLEKCSQRDVAYL
ncbi:hypothetical protein DdX_13102 [Ditylenchus destructor]|uniref:EGF-like domain-containing protein n=1 Tax=Ditylenchus destructor TaxID=166010 RepID=A0AAD4MV44_9BILA|nr:hypothetical protein DdX_13102 [Ditylenchus destructor]